MANPRTKAEVEAGHSHLPMTVEQACDALQQMVAGGGGRKQKTLSHLALTVMRPELGPKDYEAYVSIQKAEFYLYRRLLGLKAQLDACLQDLSLINHTTNESSYERIKFSN